MFRRLVKRFSEEWTAEGIAASSGGHNASSDRGEVELSLDLEDDGEDETDRWMRKVEGGGGDDQSFADDAQRSGRRLVWVPDAENMWKVASVTSESANGSSYTVIVSGGGKMEVPAAKCADYDPSHSLNLADAARMNQMHEGPLLNLIHRRFCSNTIYTNVADVLVSINPYKDIPGLYEIPMPTAAPKSSPAVRAVRAPSPGSRVAERTAALIRGFEEDRAAGMPKSFSNVNGGSGRTGDEKARGRQQGRGKEENGRGAKARLAALKNILGKPHVYGVADRAFQYMAETQGREVNGRIRKRNQSILITGESGSGKTEASKHVMRFLITASRALSESGSGRVEASSGGVRPTARPDQGGGAPAGATTSAAAKHMEGVLLRSNTVLEAFGNAKTVRNDNSSRFGKYIKLIYDEDFGLVGAKTEHFLLEKSRLVHLDRGERSYHILYQVAKALPRKIKEELSLKGGAETFTLLNQGNCLVASEDVNDHEEFKAVDKALSSLEFSPGDKKDIWRLIAAILHSGEVRFEDVLGADHCRMKKSRAEGGRGGKLTVSPDRLAALWGVDRTVFEAGVMKKTVTAGGASASVKLNAAQAKDNLLALLKHMYRQLFAWINWKINVVFDIPGGRKGGGRGNGFGSTFIGILDIFGFEIMTTNSFEQLCINYANEVLQRQFNHHIFVLEQEEYGAEGLDVASIPFRDNQNIIDLIAKRPAGLMPILEDQALTGRQAASLKASFTDKNLVDLFHQQHHRRAPHSCYRKPRFDGPEFVVMHYAGNVTYCATGFLEKNNDTLQEDLRGLLLSSTIPFLKELIMGEESGTFELGALDSRNGSLGSLPPPKNIEVDNYTSASKLEASGVVRPAHRRKSSGMLKRVPSTKMAATTTVSNAFRRQLDDLVSQLANTEPHYIKCIKPNSTKEPGGWSSPLVIEQLRYSGVLEVVRIRREAFPMRVGYKPFYRRFGKLASYKDEMLPPAEDMTPEKAQSAGLEICVKVFGKEGEGTSFQMGKTKIFLRNDGLKQLRAALRQHYFDLAARIQSVWRGAAARIWFTRQRDAAVKIQSIARGKISERRYHETRVAMIVVQAIVRMRIARCNFERRQRSTVSIQALWRGWWQRGWEARKASATRLQAVVRGFIVRRRNAREEAAIKLQMSVAPIVRGFLVRRRIKRRTRTVVALQAAIRGVTTRNMLAIEKQQRVAAKAAEREAAATRIAAVWRGKMQRLHNSEMGVSASKIQSLVRGRAARAACKAKAAKVVKAQGVVRMLLAKQGFKRTRASALRAQRAIRTFLRNRHLRNRSVQVFQAARCGDVPSVALHLSEWPELLFVRDRHDAAGNQAGLPSYATLLHAACQGGSINIVALLEPFPADVIAVDRWGNTSVHMAAARCDYDMLKLLARRANLDIVTAIRFAAADHRRTEPEAFPASMSTEAFSLAAVMVRQARLSNAAATPGRDFSKRREETSADSGDAELTVGLVGELDGGKLSSVEGFLKKRRETGWWKKRWCCLRKFSPLPGERGEQGPALLYYRTKSEKKPSKAIMLDHCLLKRSRHVSHAFELHSPILINSRNKEGRLYFQAGDEEELQRWMLPLRTIVKFYDFQNDKRASPMEFLDLETRRRLVQAQNCGGQTPLHLAAAFTGDGQSVTGASEVTAVIQRVCTWLMESGADPNTYDEEGETPVHCAAAAAQPVVVRVFEKRGSDRHLSRRADGKTAAEILLLPADNAEGANSSRQLGRRPYHIAPDRNMISLADVTDTPLLKPPAKLFGFTYISVFLEKLSLASPVKLVQPALTMSVFCPKGRPVEVAQDVTSPVLAVPDYFWWARTWHMQTPLETLGAGSLVVFELRDLQAAENKVVCWGVLPLDHELLNTQPERMSSFLPPTDPVRLKSNKGSAGCLGLTGRASRGESDAPPDADAFLTGDVLLTRALS